MSGNSFGNSFVVTTFGESHGLALGCVIDGCPPGLDLSKEDIQSELDKRKPGSSKFTTQRKEDDEVEILSGVFEGKTTGTPIGLLIRNKDQKSKDYDDLNEAEQFAISISGIKRLVPRLKSLMFQLRYPELVQDCKPHIVSATAACEEVKKSKKFAKVLELILLIGKSLIR